MLAAKQRRNHDRKAKHATIPRANPIEARYQASAIGMMWAAGWLIIEPALRRGTWLRTAVVAVGAFIALAWWSISPVQIIVAAAVLGFAWPRGTQA